MTADDIRAEARKNIESLREHVQTRELHPITLMQYGASMEIAVQLATLNERIDDIRALLDPWEPIDRKK